MWTLYVGCRALAGMAELIGSMKEMIAENKYIVEFSNGRVIDSPLVNVWRMACDRRVGKRTSPLVGVWQHTCGYIKLHTHEYMFLSLVSAF